VIAMSRSPRLAASTLKPVEVSNAVPGADAALLQNWPAIAALGCATLLRPPLLALFCSIRCPGKLILETYDLARTLRDAGVPVVSGFHTPMEKECLDLLLRGNQPIILCPARSIEGMRLPSALKTAVESGRLLLLSPFKQKDRRPTAKLAADRNRFVAALATEVFVAFAAEGGKTAELCRDLLAAGRPVLTFDSPANARLIGMGGIPVTAVALAHRWNQNGRISPNSEPSSSVL
jgi:predicted Rossmann fold nucleotide-binding protein DprA/Smf involved in DNA uptake